MAGSVLRLVVGLGVLPLSAGAANVTHSDQPPPRLELRRTYTVPNPAFLAFTPAEFAQALLRETNRVRREHKLPALVGMARLDAAADDQASITSLLFRVTHESPVAGQTTPGDRARRRGVEPRLCAENAAATSLGTGDTELSAQEIVQQLVTNWMNSPGHRANLLNRDVTHFGGSVRIVRGPYQQWYAFGIQLFVML